MPGIAYLETDGVCRQPGALQVGTGCVYGVPVQVVANNRAFQLCGNMAAGVVLDVAPVTRIVISQTLEAKGSPNAGRYTQRNPRCFDQDGTATAEGIHQGLRGVPSGQCQQAGGQILAQGRFALLEAPAAFEQRLARGVQVQRAGVFGKEQMYAGVRSDGVDVGALALSVAQPVTNAILGPQIAVLQALHGAAYGRGVYPQGLFGAEPSFPWRIHGKVQNVVLVVHRPMVDFYQYARSQPGIKIGPQNAGPVSVKLASRPVRGGVVKAQRLHLRS